MPIHDQGYRRYRGGKAGGRAWLVIMKTGIRTMLGDKKFIVLLAAAWLQFLVRAVQFYIAANFSQAAVIAPKADTFRDFFDKQDIFVYILTVTLGSRLIAQDRRVNALQIYLAKPLTRAEYIFGKLGILASFLLFVTWVPAILLLGVQVVFAGNFEFLTANAYLFPAITIYAALEVAMTSTTMLALSSLSTNSRFVGIMYTGLIFFSLALYNVLRFITGSTRLSWVGFGNNLTQLGDVIFRVPPHFQTPWPVSLLIVVILIAVSALVLERRVRGVEIIA
jgi:ABC-type transport system involved in multi-copper enzyme maturation permease subunit